MKIIAGNSNAPLASAVAQHLGVPLTNASIRRFSDQEIFVEVFENVRGEDMYVIQSTSNPANDNLMELLIMTDALLGANRRGMDVELSTPAYSHAGAVLAARVDMRFRRGHPPWRADVRLETNDLLKPRARVWRSRSSHA